MGDICICLPQPRRLVAPPETHSLFQNHALAPFVDNSFSLLSPLRGRRSTRFPLPDPCAPPLCSIFRQPLSGPLPCPFVPLRGYLLSFLPLHAPLSSLFQPLRVPSWITLFPFSRRLRGYLLPLTRPLAPPALDLPGQPLSGPSCFVLRAPSWNPYGPFPSWITLLPSCPFTHPFRGFLFQPLRVPSWITLFPFSPFVDIFFPLPDPWRPPLDLPPTP